METESDVRLGFVQNRLPWLIGAGALLLFLLTMPHWVTYVGLPALARATGWDWHLNYQGPLHFLLTYPVRWLPSGWQGMALTLLTVVCSAWTLALLARSVSLLPHDRTLEQRQLERHEYSLLSQPTAWLPPLLAALVCGLQLTFWEHAVTPTGEAIDLLLFAYGLRCLLEYRIELKDSWLLRAAVVYGTGMANNLAMVGFFPAFMVALIWIRGMSFFDFRFLTRMALCGLAGLSLYLLFPILLMFSDLTDQSFWEVLRVNLGFQKNVLALRPRLHIGVMSLTSLLPLLLMGIRWPAQAGDISAAGHLLTSVLTHVTHGVLLFFCLLVTLDPPFSPRNLSIGWAYLPFYYLGALGVGYFSGYFLLVCGAKPAKAWQRPSKVRQVFNRVALGLVWIALVAMPAALFYRNLPQLRADLNPHLAQFAKAAAQTLPKGAVVFSDDMFTLYALYAALDQTGHAGEYMFLDTRSLSQVAYHRYLRRKHPDRWPGLPFDAPLGERISDATVLGLVNQLSRSNQLYYLHPSFGYYFENFYARPRQLVYEMKPLPTNSVEVPLLTAEEIRSNDEFLTKFKAEQLEGLIHQRKPRLNYKPSQITMLSGALYSRVYNNLGVELEKAGDPDGAARYFKTALELNPDNPSAFINQDYNTLRRAGKRESAEPSEGARQRLEPYEGNWNLILSENGPIDEPNVRYLLAQTFARGRNFRQAAQELVRALALVPDNLPAKLALASMYVDGRLPDRALEMVTALRASPPAGDFSVGDQLSLIHTEAWAYVLKDDLPRAEKILLSAQEKYPEHNAPFAVLAGIYRAKGRLTNAIAVLESQLKIQPNNVDALINHGAYKIQNGEIDDAIGSLDRALRLNPDHAGAMLNRAIANLQLARYDEAKRDYELLKGKLPKPLYAVHYGLAAIAEQKKDRKEALENYEIYLKLAPAGTPESNWVRDRIKVLKSGSF